MCLFFLLIVHVCIALLTFNILNPATFACVTFLLFVHICIAVVDIQFSREEDHYPFHRLNPATYVSIFSCVTFLLFVHICFIDANAQLIEELPTNLEHTSSLSIFRGVRAAQSLVFCVVFCLSLFVSLSLFPFVVTLSVLLFTASDWLPIGYLPTYFDGIERTKSKILKTCIIPLPRYYG